MTLNAARREAIGQSTSTIAIPAALDRHRGK